MRAHARLARPTPPAAFTQMWVIIRDGLPSAGRYKRYLVALAGPFALIWGTTLIYLLVAPERFDSRMTLILPGTGVGGSLNLDLSGRQRPTPRPPFPILRSAPPRITSAC